MENSNAQNPLQTPFSRFAQEIKDVLSAMRGTESAVEFELEALKLEEIAQELEWWAWKREGA